ncbi:alginate O-acetyltransferase [Candidatus Giovannonibacteria bacterium RIFCSPLOWO2_01_FULL_46_13]|uniref:Alginate O-acetyltransferase n=1 Tax=Candidatus Giovannonibacteria bacterium RIFCSPLOWO2_01_FULL_46_13 TaxID=1798352 RepID=A0A1F5X3C4_9BACT|nr:MAG: alginate O-acetyltransferase [Candidatus Giovannonibacteria bacterium RIFCSPLOWO2_01_FULL_46_13]
MLFNSRTFLVFYIVVTSLYFLIPHRLRWLLLLAGSIVFYMAFVPAYILILGWTIVVDYFAGLFIEKATGQKRKLFLIVSLVSNVGVLAFFKYFNFLNESLTALLGTIGIANSVPFLTILLPIGLSFHTFQAMSYTIEVYRGRNAERNFGIFALYVMFYPQLVAGPIERPQNLLHQFYEKHEFDYRRMSDGIKLMLWGLFKKAVIADRLAILVDRVYADPLSYGGAHFIVATVFFAFQIYCDFSGYTDMARGAAHTMGFRLMENFLRPYHARSVQEFWRRWHISLTTWFRDYLYIPLGGNRVPLTRWYFNIFIVFLISGLWHGASWNFIIWGALHGLFLLMSISTKRIREAFVRAVRLDRVPVVHNLLQTLITFSLVAFAWIFFRASSLADALYIVFHLPEGVVSLFDITSLPQIFGGFRLRGVELTLAFFGLALLGIVEYLERFGSIRERIKRYPLWVRWSMAYALLAGAYFLGVYDDIEFIYFQF